MTSKSAFTDEEWARVRRAPFVAGMAISLADPGGPIEMSKETIATIRAATNPPSREQLLAEVALDIQSMTQQKQNPLKDYALDKGSKPGQQVLDELREVQAAVAAKATPEESRAFAEWLLATAQAAADAAKEGGFMGFGAKQVSEGEQAMLDQVRSALGIA
jgi:methanogenic corrinoid protein MtbC1